MVISALMPAMLHHPTVVTGRVGWHGAGVVHDSARAPQRAEGRLDERVCSNHAHASVSLFVRSLVSPITGPWGLRVHRRRSNSKVDHCAAYFAVAGSYWVH